MLLCPAMALTLFAWLGNCYFAEYELPLRASGGAIFLPAEHLHTLSAGAAHSCPYYYGGSVAAVVWADRIRPQHKAPPFGVLRAGSTARRPLLERTG